MARVKALMCGACGDFKALARDGSWRECECGTVAARWTDSHRGLAEFWTEAESERRYAFVLGLNNHLLQPALEGRLGMHADFRAAHDLATDAPSHVFDKSRCSCWAVVFAVGRTNDVAWAETGPGRDPGVSTST